MKQVIVFSIEGQKFGLDLELVSSILEYTKPTPIPNAHKSITGVINVRGEIFVMVDSSSLLGGVIEKEDSRIILLDVEEKIGLLVQSTSNVITIKDEYLQSESSLIGSYEESYIKQVINYQGEIIIEIDMDQVIKTLI